MLSSRISISRKGCTLLSSRSKSRGQQRANLKYAQHYLVHADYEIGTALTLLEGNPEGERWTPRAQKLFDDCLALRNEMQEAFDA